MDGEIDYSKYTTDELNESLSRIDKQRYPRNYAKLIEEIRTRPGVPPPRAEEWSSHKPVSIIRYGVMCFAGMFLCIVVLNFLETLAGARAPQTTVFVGLFASMQFATWRFVRTHRREFEATELRWFIFSCCLAFWIWDELPAVYGGFSSSEVSILRKGVEAIAASCVDILIVAPIAYLTVPWAAKRFLRGGAH
jgi:hypothetical protein